MSIRPQNVRVAKKPEAASTVGMEGRMAKDCKAHPFCVVCKRDGHRSDQMKCLVFRKLVNTERDRKETKRHNSQTRTPVLKLAEATEAKTAMEVGGEPTGHSLGGSRNGRLMLSI